VKGDAVFTIDPLARRTGMRSDSRTTGTAGTVAATSRTLRFEVSSKVHYFTFRVRYRWSSLTGTAARTGVAHFGKHTWHTRCASGRYQNAQLPCAGQTKGKMCSVLITHTFPLRVSCCNRHRQETRLFRFSHRVALVTVLRANTSHGERTT